MNPRVPLSITQILIVQLICQQKTSDEIAKHLEKSRRTIENQRQKICKILKVKNTAGIVMYSVTNNIVKKDPSLKA